MKTGNNNNEEKISINIRAHTHIQFHTNLNDNWTAKTVSKANSVHYVHVCISLSRCVFIVLFQIRK